MSAFRISLLLIVLFGGLVLIDAQSPSKNLLNFWTMLNGYNTDIRQKVVDAVDDQLEDEHDLIILIWRPVQVAAFPDQLSIYLEEIVKGNINRMTLLVLREDAFGIIHAEPLTVVPPHGYRPKQYEYEDMTNVALESLTAPPECEVLYEQLEENVYVGSYPDCVSNVEWPPTRYSDTVTCNTFSSLTCSAYSRETYSKSPYIFYRKRRYPLPPSVTVDANFTAPCNFN